MQKLIIISHVIPGFIALLFGIIVYFSRKGNKLHVTLGWIYTASMFWVCLSAFLHIAFFRFSFFLLVIGVITFNSTYSGIRIVRRKTASSDRWYDRLVASLTFGFGLFLLGYGVNIFIKYEGIHALGILSVLFGVITGLRGLEDLILFIKKPTKPASWWLDQHIGAMSGSYVAAITAFAVQSGNTYFADAAWNWLFWVAPALILSPILRSYRKKMKSTSVA